jgi:hypothetical protein
MESEENESMDIDDYSDSSGSVALKFPEECSEGSSGPEGDSDDTGPGLTMMVSGFLTPSSF